MKVFIFGAGASKGAQQGAVHDAVIAPLSNDLFDLRYQVYADRVGLSEATMNLYRNEIAKFSFFEEWLTNEWNRVGNLKEKRTKDAQRGFLAQVAFYIWLTLLHVSKWTHNDDKRSRELNVYSVLLRKLFVADIPFGLINFNYDLLLDIAYKDVFKLTFQNMNDYLSNDYVKPHGSVNWLLPLRESDRRIDTIHENNMDTKIRLDTAISSMYRDVSIPLSGLIVKDPDHRDLYTIDDLLRSFNSQYFYPLIFLPLTSKEYSAIQGFEQEIISKGKELIGSAREIYLIGYRASDDIIKELLNSTRRDTMLHVVGLDTAEQIMEKTLKLNSNLKKGFIFNEGFHHFAHNIKL